MYQNLWTQYLLDVKASIDECYKINRKINWGKGVEIRAHKNAANALYHFREHWEKAVDPSITYEYVNGECESYSLLGNVANASKHYILTRGKPVAKSATAIMDRLKIFIFSDALGEYDHSEKGVILLADDETVYDVWDLIVEVHNFFADLMLKKGIAQGYFLYQKNKEEVRARSASNPSKNYVYDQLEGAGFACYFTMLKYDYQNNEYEELNIKSIRMLNNKTDLSLNSILRIT
ncbi:hypothetical protein GCM10027299_22000 [Larkinella ripae]